MFTNREMKKSIVEEVAADRRRRKARAAELKAMTQEQREDAKRKDKAAKKEAKLLRKEAIQKMPKEERKLAKKHDKVYKKVKARPRRAVVWTAVALVVVLVVVNVAPIVQNMSGLMSMKLAYDTPEGEAIRKDAFVLAEDVSDEGIVLLKNEDNALPLSDGRLNVFGMSSFDIQYGGGGSGAASTEAAVDLYAGLSGAGIQYNEALYDFYESQGAVKEKEDGNALIGMVKNVILGGEKDTEPAVEYLTDEVMKEAKAYSENAMIVVTSSATETSDLTAEALKPSANSMALIEKVAAQFENVIIVVNSGNALQLGFVDEYESVNGVVWVGTPGPAGCVSLAKVLKGEINPSGRLVDTYAYDAKSCPASVTLGDYAYDNAGMHLLNYNEGIYVGYRFYETYYEGDEAGYKKAVQYPFGYGLSYTDFKWELEATDFDREDISVDVKVTNTGDVEGKDVVEVYFTAPYTTGGIEKSAIELAGYQKTGLLKPGESETVTVRFAVRDMSSYDMEDEEAYVLEAGTYEIKIGKNVHDIVETAEYVVEDNVVYDTDETTGTKLENRFEFAEGDLTYLSRQDWEGTYPKQEDIDTTASDEVAEGFTQKPEKVEGGLPAMEADNGILLEELKGLAYDDPKWEQFMDQFSLEEMKMMFLDGAYMTRGVERLGVPEAVFLDGPAGINSMFAKVTAASYPTEVVVASTWNDELAERIGTAIGEEANAYGVHGWYAPGMNVHRTAMGGRNFEFFSEDPLISGKMSAAMVRGCQSKNVVVFMKHFIINNQEINARSGVAVWTNEQALRELYLRAFEITTKESNPHGAMSSFIYMGTKWCGGSAELLNDVLREEWGFDGMVTTDAVLGKFMDINMAVRNGNDIMLDPMVGSNQKYFDKLYKEDPVGIAVNLRDRVHTICYTLVNYTEACE